MPSNTNEVHATPAFRNVNDLCDALLWKNNSFRALGALLSTSRLSEFDPDACGTPDVDNLRVGLGQLVELIVDDQERAIELFRDGYLESDEFLLKAAVDNLKDVKNGERLPVEIFKKVMEGLHTVIMRDAGTRPMAEALLEALGQYAPLSVRKVAHGGAR